MWEGIIQSKSKTFFSYCFCFLLGVAVASLIDSHPPFVWYYGVIFVFIAAFILFWRKKFWLFITVCLFCFVLGTLRYGAAFPFSRYHVSTFTGQTVGLVGWIATEPDIRQDSIRYLLEVETAEGLDAPLHGRVYFKSALYPRYRYGDQLYVQCVLQEPEPIEDFRYDLYLARMGVFAVCNGPQVTPISSGSGSRLFRHVLQTKEMVADRINTLWHEPHAGFMAGLLYGYRGGLGSLNELFSRTGVTHIIAISGYNITIISTILIAVCVHLYIPRQKAFYLVVTGIAVFLIFVGLSASVVRAGIMGSIVLFARQLGRASRVGNVLILTATLMTLHNPFILMWDAGFQLSFISTLGLVYLTPRLEPWFARLPEVLGIQESVTSTMAAIVATLPLILYQFGRLSVVAPLVNVLILWAIPFIMLLGFIAVVADFVFAPLALIVSWIAYVGLEYIIRVVRWFAHLPFAAVDISIPWWAMAVCYAGLFLVVKNRDRVVIR